MNRRCLPCFLALIPLLPMVVLADGTTPIQLEEMVVTAGRLAEPHRLVTASVQVIDRAAIAASATTTLADLLAEIGVAQIRKYPGSLTSVGLRGFRTDTHGNDLQGHVLILLDGRRAGTGNAAMLLTDNIERVEIIRGPAAVQYGSASMGGVINIITRRGQAASAFTEVGGGSRGHGTGSFGATFSTEKIDFSATLSTAQTDDYTTGHGQTFANTGTDSQTGFSLNSGYALTKEQRLGLILTGVMVNDAGNPGYLSQNDLDDSTDKRNISLDGSYQGATADGRDSWLARYFLGQDKNVWSSPSAFNPDGYDDDLDADNSTDQQGAQAQLTHDFGSFSTTVGLDWLYYEVKNSWSPQRSSSTNPAFFLLARTGLLDQKINLTAGLRQDWFMVEVAEPAGRDEDQHHLTPQVGLAWQASDRLTLRLQYAEGFTLPSAAQLAIDSTSFGTRTLGNPDLQPEQSVTREVGLDYRQGSLTASLTSFTTDFTDKIISMTRTDGNRSWQNLGDATIAGVEAEFSYDLGEPLDLNWAISPYLNLTLLNEFADETTGADLQYVSEMTAAVGISIDNGQGLSCRLAVSHSGSQKVVDYQSDLSPQPVVDLAGATVAGLSASWRFWQNPSSDGGLTLKASIDNLSDAEYAYVKGYPMPGRTFGLALRWDY